MGGRRGDAGWGADPTSLRISFPCPMTMASGVWLKEAEQLVALYAYRLRGGRYKLEAVVRGR